MPDPIRPASGRLRRATHTPAVGTAPIHLVFPAKIYNDLFVGALEVNRAGEIAISWLFALQEGI